MATTKIHGANQIQDATITNTQIAAAAAIANSKLAGDPVSTATASKIIVRDANGRAAVADPSASGDIATKSYVDSVAQGLNVKASCRVATTANITLSGTQTIDGVSVIAGNRVLVKNQTTGAENGIYVCAAGAWSRATDADVSAEVTAGMYTWIEEGTANQDTGWLLTTDNPITLGTTALVFSQFSGAAMITAGAGLTKTGNTLDVGAGNGIQVNADSVETIYGGTGDMVASAVGDSVGAGTANKASRSDHKHAREAFATNTIALNSAAAAGSATTLIRSDATIAAFDVTAPSTQAIGDSAVVGTIAYAARRDHKHAMPAFGSPIAEPLGAANSDGASLNVAHCNHIHALGRLVRDDTVGNGSTTTFDASTNGDSQGVCLVFLNGLLQRAGGGFDCTITFNINKWQAVMASAPSASDVVSLYYWTAPGI